MILPVAYTIAEACAVARAGQTALYEAIRRGALMARKRVRKTLSPVGLMVVCPCFAIVEPLIDSQ
jgi:hypothetical protein